MRDYTEGRSITELEIQRGCLNPGATRAPKCERSIFCFRDDAFLEQVSEGGERERGCCVRSFLLPSIAAASIAVIRDSRGGQYFLRVGQLYRCLWSDASC